MIARTTLAILFASLLVAAAPAGATTNHGLRAIHAITAARHAGVDHVTSDQLAVKLRTAPADVLILDVRETREFAVSHIPGARHIPPEITAAQFTRAFGDQLAGRKIILYCSVGVRSTELASRIRRAALEAGAVSVANLTGGIFGWHNEKRRLTDANGPTSSIHPYNSFWGTLIERDQLISYGADAALPKSEDATSPR